MAALTLAAPISGAQDVDAPSDETPASDPPPQPGGSFPNRAAEALLRLPERASDPRELRLAALAQLERQGLGVPGASAFLAREAYGHSAVPTRTVHDFSAPCDLNDDGIPDTVTNDFDPATALSDVFARSGADGEHLWRSRNLFYLSLSQVTGNLYPARARLPGSGSGGLHGTPEPRLAENFGTSPDLNGDGVCDFVAFGFEFNRLAQLGYAGAFPFRVRIHAIDGATGKDLWTRDLDGVTAFATVPSNPELTHYEIQGFPSGFVVFDTESGPRFALKTTDIFYAYAWERSLTGMWLQDYRVNENVTYWDARSGDERWRTQIQFSGEGDATNFTWFTGPLRLDDDAEPEIVLDSLWVADPQCSCEMNDPFTGRPLFRYGRGVGAMALNGADGGEKWRVVVHDELQGEVNAQSEESFQTVLWNFGQALPDLNGNGVPDVMVLYLAVEWNEGGLTNGRMRTHLAPIDGNDGSRIWRGDRQFRGWGYVSAMNVDGSSTPYVAFGSADLPIQGEVAASGRFPEKFVQLRVLDAKEGTLVWDYEDRFQQDSYLPFDLALHQFRATLAPHDWNGDGVRDLVTPGRYVPPREGFQELLATARQEYRILDGKGGDPIQTVTAWGSNGYAMRCPGATGDLTIVSGHARRIDLSRFDGATGERLWRQPVFNDGRIQSASRGSDLWALGSACADFTVSNESRTFFGLNVWRYTPNRRDEVSAAVGFLAPNGGILWSDPKLNPDPGILSFLELLPEPVAPPTATQHAVVNGAPILFGLAAGLGIGLLRNRARGPREAAP